MRHPLILLVILAALLAQACGGGDAATTAADDGGDTAATAPADAGAEDTAAPTEAGEDESASTVAVESTDLGRVLVDAEGRTLYLFDNDAQGESTCYDDCEGNWPPLEGPAAAGTGVDEALLGVVEREDGTQQATYNDWPLYYFAGDEQPGDVNGQGVGDVWWAVTAAGERAEQGGGDDDGALDY